MTSVAEYQLRLFIQNCLDFSEKYFCLKILDQWNNFKCRLFQITNFNLTALLCKTGPTLHQISFTPCHYQGKIYLILKTSNYIGIQTSNLLQNAQVKSSKMTQISAYFSLSTPLPYLIGVATYNNENWNSIGLLHQMACKMGTGQVISN